MMDATTEDLFNRALSLGYGEDGAARVADAFFPVSGIIDPCAKHPAHSTTIRDGYTVDDCEACEVIALSNAQGYTLAGWQATQDKRKADHVAFLNAELAEAAPGSCVCWIIFELGSDNLPEGGRTCGGCGSVFTRPGEEASQQVATVSAEVVKRNAADAKSGIDVLRELLTLEPVKRVKVATVHYISRDAKPYSDGQITMADGKTMSQGRGTSVLADVTCKGCKRSRAFDMAEYREYLAAAQAEEAPVTEAEAEAIEADRAGVMVGQIILVGKYELANVTFASTSKVCAQGDHQTHVWDEDSWADALASRAVTVFDEDDVAEMLVEARAEGFNTIEQWLHDQAVEEARRPVAKSAQPRLA